tara:strand:- start:232 stop:825 length:594 start_codon:yes stop_codon:yes gene_type:complete
MKFNLIKIKKYNHLIIAFIIFIYLINCIINNNFNETFIIFIILIIGYVLINYNIFYILLLFIIINNLFLKFNNLKEGLTDSNGCPIPSQTANLIKSTNAKTAPANQSQVVNALKEDALKEDALKEDALKVKNAAINALSNSYNDEDSPRVNISESSADIMSNSEPNIQANAITPVPSTCSTNSSSLLSGSMNYDPYE